MFQQIIRSKNKISSHNEAGAALNNSKFLNRFLFHILIFFGIFFNNSIAQSPGNISVQTWADGKDAAFSFSFDDALNSHFVNAYPILEDFGFNGTFYLSTSRIVDSIPGNGMKGAWDDFRTMALDGHEMGAHSITHEHLVTLPVGDENTPGTLIYELYQSREKIEEEIPSQKCITFAYPFAEHNNTVDYYTSQYYESARADGDTYVDQSPAGMSWYQLTGYELWYDLPRNSIEDDFDELNDLENWISGAISSNKWGIFFAHEIVPFEELDSLINYGEWEPTSNEIFTMLCEFVKDKSDNGDLWVETIANITRYVKERDNVNFQVVQVTDSLLEVNATDGLDDDIYNFPLTVDITVPADWDTVVVTQNNISDTLVASNNLVRTKIIPDNGNIIVKSLVEQPVIETYSIAGIITYNNQSGSPLSNVQLNLTGGGTNLIALTNSTGYFDFQDLPAGNYTITFVKEDNWGGVNSTDALLTSKYFIGEQTLDSLQTLSADVNNSGSVNSTDALLIQSRFVGLIDQFTKPDWLFLPEQIVVTIVDTNVELNITGNGTGDVNSSHLPGT